MLTPSTIKPVEGAARYYVGMAALGYAVVMVDTEGHSSCIQVGIRAPGVAMKKADSWQRRENQAVLKAKKG
jgi:hypothetical protein